MRTRALVLLAALLLATAAFGLHRRLSRPPSPAPACSQVVGIIGDSGERLGCLDDPALASCGALRPGFAYRSCARLHPLRGALLVLHGLPIDANEGTAEDLAALPGVGPGTAQALVDARASGPLCSAADLERARGIGAKRAAELARLLAFDAPACHHDSAQ